MSKRQTFVIGLIFSDKIVSDDDIQEVAENLHHAILHEIESGEGIAPVNTDAITESVTISQQGIILTETKIDY